MHDDDRRLGHGFELLVGDDDGDLDDAIAVGFEAGHLYVQPYQVFGVLCHNPCASLQCQQIRAFATKARG